MLVWCRSLDLLSLHPEFNQVEATGKTKFIYNDVNPVHVAEPASEPKLKQQGTVNRPLASTDVPPASPSFATPSIILRSAAGSSVPAVRRMLCRAAAQSDTIQWCVVSACLVGAGAGLTDVLGFCIIVPTHVSRFLVTCRSLCF